MLHTTLTVFAIVVVVSMFVACVIWALVALMGRERPAAAPAATPAPAPPRPAATTSGAPVAAGEQTSGPVTEGGHPARHVAAIAAAVAAVFDDRAVVVHIEPARGAGGWTSEGRAAHHSSHNVGHSPR